MTNNHPITPPPELVQKLADGPGTWLEKISQAYRAGADQELEACCAGIHMLYGKCGADWLRVRRRPKPPSLKEQALETLRSMKIGPVFIAGINVNADAMKKYDLIRRALEQLSD